MSETKLVPCRCGREAEEILDGSLFGCVECFVSASSPAEWNALVGKEQDDYSAEFDAFCQAEGYSGDVFKANLWKVWCASRAAVEIHLPQYDGHEMYGDQQNEAVELCKRRIEAAGLRVKE